MNYECILFSYDVKQLMQSYVSLHCFILAVQKQNYEQNP